MIETWNSDMQEYTVGPFGEQDEEIALMYTRKEALTDHMG